MGLSHKTNNNDNNPSEIIGTLFLLSNKSMMTDFWKVFEKDYLFGKARKNHLKTIVFNEKNLLSRYCSI